MITFSSTVEIILFVIEVIGCISFATSGAVTALRKKADLLGVWILTLLSVFGGGLLRDLILHNGVPHIFWDPEYLWLALISIVISTVCFVLACIPKTAKGLEHHRHDFWIYAVDAVGVSVFCVAGAKLAYNALPSTIGIFETYIFVTSLGVITGVCGGMFRDVCLGEIPTVFKKRFYMMPCLIGTAVYTVFFLNNWGDSSGIVAILIGCGTIITLRILAVIFKWNMPVAKAFNTVVDEETKEQKEKKN